MKWRMSALPTIAATANPHYQRLGGADAVVQLVDAFYAAMDSRDDARAIRAMHPRDLAPVKAVLVAYFSEWLGGPQRYSAERGAPRLRRVHLPFVIDRAARQAWLACMDQALTQIGAEPELHEELNAAFAKIAAHIENSESPHHRSP